MTLVHRTLGEQRINTICSEHHLRPEDRAIIDQILVRWERLIGKPAEKMAVVMELAGQHPRRSDIIRANTQICMEFMELRTARQ